MVLQQEVVSYLHFEKAGLKLENDIIYWTKNESIEKSEENLKYFRKYWFQELKNTAVR